MWNLFIDDERNLQDVTWAPRRMQERYREQQWTVVRNRDQAIQAIINHGLIAPNFISFDHDLGNNEPTGFNIAQWIVDQHMDGNLEIPADFDFYVHSMNPVGRENIERYLRNYIRHLEYDGQRGRRDNMSDTGDLDYEI
jgi:hypothetical protein